MWKQEQGVTPKFEKEAREGLVSPIDVDIAELDVRASEVLPGKPKPRSVKKESEQRTPEKPAETETDPAQTAYRQARKEHSRLIAEEDALLRERKKIDPGFSIEQFQRITATNPWKIKYDRTKRSDLASPAELQEKADILNGLNQDMINRNETLKQEIFRLKHAHEK